MIQLSIKGEIVSVSENTYTNEETKKTFHSWRIFLLNPKNNFSPVLAVALDYDFGLANGFADQNFLNSLKGKTVELITEEPSTFSGKLMANFDKMAVVK